MEVKNEVTNSDYTITVPLQLSLVWAGVCSIEFSGALLLKGTQEGSLSLALQNWNLRARDIDEAREP